MQQPLLPSMRSRRLWCWYLTRLSQQSQQQRAHQQRCSRKIIWQWL
jgi:hypothetical protein